MDSKIMQNKLTWLARIITLAYALFIASLALDVFHMTAPMWQKVVGFLFRLMPAVGLLLALMAYWNNPLYGGAAFILLSLAFTVVFRTYTSGIALLALSLPLLVVGLLFISVYLLGKKNPD